MSSSKITIHEIAREAGVSVATISRAIHSETRAKVAPETLKKIDRLIGKYRYTPNAAAQRLNQSAYNTIGVLFPHHHGSLISDYYSQILSGVADSLLDSRYQLKMILLKPGHWDHYAFKKGESVDGLLMTYWRTFFSSAEVFRKLDVPCVVINNPENNVHARFWAGDHYEGGRLAAEHLYSRGHRRIAVLTGSHQSPDTLARFAGFNDYLKSQQISLAPELIFDVNYEEQKAYDMTEKILAVRPEVTAVFCMNDIQAYGVLRRLEELRVPCPDRISVIGYDDDRRSEHTQPPLTTLRVPVYELAQKAANDLIAYLKGDLSQKEFFQTKHLPVSLIERQSVK